MPDLVAWLAATAFAPGHAVDAEGRFEFAGLPDREQRRVVALAGHLARLRTVTRGVAPVVR